MKPISNEVLASQIDTLTVQVNKLEAKLDAYATHFVTAEVYEIKNHDLELRVDSLYNKINNIDRNHTLKSWVLGTTSAGGGIILALLLQFFLTHQGK